MASKYKLTYFNLRGRAEHIRMIFAAAEVAYEDVRMGEEWKDFKAKTPYGGMPVLETEGVMLGESTAIARYVAKQAKLYGDTPIDQALSDAAVDMILDIRESYLFKIVFEKDEAKKAEMVTNLKEKSLPNTLGNLNKMLGDGNYLVNNKLSWADLVFYHVIEYVDELQFGEDVDKFPKLRALVKRVGELPGMAKYLKQRPETR